MSVKHLVPVVLPADPVSALEAAPKQYVDAKPGFNFIQEAQPTGTTPGQTWFNTATGDSFVWVVDINSSQWVQTGPGVPPSPGMPPGGAVGETLTKLSGTDFDASWEPGGGSGFTFVQDTTPAPTQIGDTWFDLSTASSGGTSWVAVEESPGGEIVWVQFAPGMGNIPASCFCFVKGPTGTPNGITNWATLLNQKGLVHSGTRITCADVDSAGIYQVTVFYGFWPASYWPAWGDGWVAGYVTKNGAVIAETQSPWMSNQGTRMVVSSIVELKSGDYIETGLSAIPTATGPYYQDFTTLSVARMSTS